MINAGLARKREALTPLVSLVDDFFARGELLKLRGWRSFEPYWMFRQSLCSRDEWSLFGKVYIEILKERVGNYESDLLDGLKRDKLGTDVLWLTECDRIYRDIESSKDYDVAYAPFKAQEQRLRMQEIEMHATNISRSRNESDEREKRIRIWGEVVQEIGCTIGLQTKSKMSGAPVFSCDLANGWRFAVGVDVSALGAETAETIVKPLGMDPLPIGAHITWKVLVPAGKTKINYRDPELIFVPQVFFPFENAYNRFWDLEGLEINVRAEFTALALIWGELRLRLIEGTSHI